MAAEARVASRVMNKKAEDEGGASRQRSVGSRLSPSLSATGVLFLQLDNKKNKTDKLSGGYA